MTYLTEPHDVHGFKIVRKEPIWGDMGPILILQVKDSGGVSGTLYGREDAPVFMGRAFRHSMNKRTTITVEISPNGGD